MVRGFIINVSFRGDTTNLWVRSGSTIQCIKVPYHPAIYVEGGDRRVLQKLPFVESVTITRNVTLGDGSKLDEVHMVSITSPKRVGKVLKSLRSMNLRTFNSDLHPRQKFFYDTHSFPFGLCDISTDDGLQIEMLDSPSDLFYNLPDMPVMQLSLTPNSKHAFPQWGDPLMEVNVSYYPSQVNVATGCKSVSEIREYSPFEMVPSSPTIFLLRHADEKELLLQLHALLQILDPDFLLIEDGDSFGINYLHHRAVANGLQGKFYLGRQQIKLYPREEVEGKSYMSYGIMTHKTLPAFVEGRIHIDPKNSFFLNDGGIYGLIELSRLSAMPPDRCARSSIGTVLTSIELKIAFDSLPQILVPELKAKGEEFKDSSQLLAADNGGVVYPAKPGLYEDVWGIDFASLYPSLMLKYNISSETVLCSCCAEEGNNLVPFLGYWICRRRQGIVPRTMQLIMEKRLGYKYIKDAVNFPNFEWINRIDSSLKWILVSCLVGSTMTIVRQGGHIITERMDRIIEEFDLDGLEVLGIDKSGNLEFKSVQRFIKVPPTSPMYQLTFQNGTCIVATGDHLWPVLRPEGWTIVRTDNLKTTDCIPYVENLEQSSPSIRSKMQVDARAGMFSKLLKFHDQDPSGMFLQVSSYSTTLRNPIKISQLDIVPDFVYCFELDSPTPWFVVEDGYVTHNCFGYLGFKNARWGSIESHQCVTAYARDYLLQAEQIVSELGYETVAGITDSLFVKGGDVPIDELLYQISRKLGVFMDVDGRFNWLVFANVKNHDGVAALNRYFGAYAPGNFKIRGIESRKRSTCLMIREFQEECLQFLSRMKGREEFLAAVPGVRLILQGWKAKLKAGIDARKLIIKLRSGKGADGYRSNSLQADVAREYLKKGRKVLPGESMLFVMVDNGAKEGRVQIAPEVSKFSKYDVEWYCTLLDRAYEDLMTPVLKDIKPLTIDDFFTDS